MKHLVNYRREVDKGKLTAVGNFENMTFRFSDEAEGLTLETSTFQNSLRRLIYLYQLHVDNKLSLLTMSDCFKTKVVGCNLYSHA